MTHTSKTEFDRLGKDVNQKHPPLASEDAKQKTEMHYCTQCLDIIPKTESTLVLIEGFGEHPYNGNFSENFYNKIHCLCETCYELAMLAHNYGNKNSITDQLEEWFTAREVIKVDGHYSIVKIGIQVKLSDYYPEMLTLEGELIDDFVIGLNPVVQEKQQVK